jgi:hypothetical protein
VCQEKSEESSTRSVPPISVVQFKAESRTHKPRSRPSLVLCAHKKPHTRTPHTHTHHANPHTTRALTHTHIHSHVRLASRCDATSRLSRIFNSVKPKPRGSFYTLKHTTLNQCHSAVLAAVRAAPPARARASKLLCTVSRRALRTLRAHFCLAIALTSATCARRCAAAAHHFTPKCVLSASTCALRAQSAVTCLSRLIR